MDDNNEGLQNNRIVHTSLYLCIFYMRELASKKKSTIYKTSTIGWFRG